MSRRIARAPSALLFISFVSSAVHAQEPPAPDPAPPVKPPPPSRPSLPQASVTGYLQSVYEDPHDTNDDGAVAPDSFSMKRVRVRLKADFRDRVGFTILLELATAQSPLRDGYVTLKLPHHELRFGQQKTPFGYENPLSSTNLYTVNRALVSDQLGRGPDLRDLALGVYGTWKLPFDLGAEYAVTLSNGTGANRREDTERKNVWGRAGVTYAPKGLGVSGALGVSAARGDQLALGELAMDPSDDFHALFHRLGVDVRLDTKWLFLVFEYLLGSTEITADGAAADPRGWYALAVGKTPWNGGPLFKIDQLDLDKGTAGNSNLRYTVGGYYDFGKTVRVLANYELDRSDTRKDDVLLLFAQFVY
jgi:hypothetical protein